MSASLPVKKCLVTGAGGFVGAALTRELFKDGHSIRVLLRRRESALNLHGLTLEIFVADILNEEAVREGGPGIDCFFFSASLFVAPPLFSSFPPTKILMNV